MSETALPADPPEPVSWLGPSWLRLALAAAVAVAVAGFLLPQEVPLEWYPLNEPGTDINYLELNRGLIRNSLHFARHVAPVFPPDLRLELDLTTTHPALQAQVFWDTGAGFSEADSIRAQPEPHVHQQTLRFALPDRQIRALRFDPLNGATTMGIRGLRLVDVGHRTRALLPLDSFSAGREIARLEVKEDQLVIETTAEARDPILGFTPEAVAQVNAVLRASSAR